MMLTITWHRGMETIVIKCLHGQEVTEAQLIAFHWVN